MNKHLKCLLKILGTVCIILPIAIVVAGVCFPVVLVSALSELSGCGEISLERRCVKPFEALCEWWYNL